MKNTTNILGKAGVLLLAATFILSSTAVIAETTIQPTSTTTAPLMGTLPKEEIELKYYDPATLTNVIGLGGGTPPYYWASGVRFTQDEMGIYTGWEMTKVVVALSCDNGQSEVYADLKIYGEGTATNPGSIIYEVDDLFFDASDIYIIDLTTPIPLDDHDEIWVTMYWEQTEEPAYIPVCDAGPAVKGKGNMAWFNNVWQQLPTTLDYNWGMGAIIEGEGLAELTVQNVAGPIGVKGEIKNIATNPAMNVEYTVTITGGILGKVNKVVTGTVTELAAGAIEAFNSGIFFGIGKITIAVEATADNALDAAANFEGTVIGPFVIGIK